VVAFTSGSAATSFVRTAEELGRLAEAADALREWVFAACVGPVTAEPLLRAGLPVTESTSAGTLRLSTPCRSPSGRMPNGS
jgi:uroporphyrinogen-III synthase